MDIIRYSEPNGPLQTERQFLYAFVTFDVFFVKSVFHFQLLVNLHGYIILFIIVIDRLSGLVVRVLGYRDRGYKFDSRSYQIL
jgi:hypothetical protein